MIAMAYSQLFNLLCERADDVYGMAGCRSMCAASLDEAANIGQIPRLEKLVATIRSREVSACHRPAGAESQLKAIYKDNADTIDRELVMPRYSSERQGADHLKGAGGNPLGKETIDTLQYRLRASGYVAASHGLSITRRLGKDVPYLFVKSSVALNLS